MASAIVKATDDFNRADAGDLGANWTNGYTASPGTSKLLGITSNKAMQQGGGSGRSAAYYSALTWADNQQASCVVGIVATWELGPMVRCSGTDSSFTGYVANVRNGGQIDIAQKSGTGTTRTILAITGLTVADSDTIVLRAYGPTLTAFQNGASIGSADDTVLTSGAPGIWCENAADTLENFIGSEVFQFLPRA